MDDEACESSTENTAIQSIKRLPTLLFPTLLFRHPADWGLAPAAQVSTKSITKKKRRIDHQPFTKIVKPWGSEIFFQEGLVRGSNHSQEGRSNQMHEFQTSRRNMIPDTLCIWPGFVQVMEHRRIPVEAEQVGT